METIANMFQAEIVQRLGWTLVHFVWQATAVALIVAAALRLLRKSSANLRYMVACMGLALIVLMPAITFRMVDVSADIVVPVKQAGVDLRKAGADTQAVVELPQVELPPAQVAAAPRVSLKDKFIETVEPALPYVVVGWLVGVFGLSLWHLGGWRQLQRLRRRMVKQAKPALRNKVRVLAERLGIGRAIGLMESALVQVPTVVGHLKPVILLPASALSGLSCEQIEAILAHELAHIKRHDYLVNMLQTVVEILGFYHPAVWWVSRKIRVERENCCDDLAVSISGDRICYARALTTMEEIRAGQPALAVAASGGSLLMRIRRLLGKDSANEGKLSWVPSVIAILIITSLLIPISFAMSSRTKVDIESTVEKLDYSSVTVEEGVGFDDIIFGCTGDFIKSKLGKPDKEVHNQKDWWLNYRKTYGLGFWVNPQEDFLIEIRLNKGFRGKLTSGISMASTREQVFDIYGKPIKEETVEDFDERYDDQVLLHRSGLLGRLKPDKIYYDKYGLLFWFYGDEIKQIVIYRKSSRMPGQIEYFKRQLGEPVTVHIDKSPDGDRLTIQYAVMAVCKAAGVPYNWDKSAKYADPQRRNYIEPVNIENNIASQAIADMVGPVGLLYGVDAAGVYLYKPEKAAEIQSNLEILNIELEPVAQGKNTLYATIRNTSDTEQLFAIHIYTRSVDYGLHGVGWGTRFFEELKPNEIKRTRFVYKIQGPVTENTYVRVKFYNPESEKEYDYGKPFAVRVYNSSDLQKQKPSKELQPVSGKQFEEISKTLKTVQNHIRNRDYEKAWDLFTEEHKKAEYQTRGFEAFKRQMEPKHKLDSAFTWERTDFLGLKPQKAVRIKSEDVYTLIAVTDNQQWQIDFIKDNGQWNIDWIGGYIPKILEIQEQDTESEKQSKNETRKDEIEITARFLLVPVDANGLTSFFEEKGLEEALVNINGDPNSKSYFLDDERTQQLLKLVNANPNSKTLATPTFIVNDGEKAMLRTERKIGYKYTGPNAASEQPKEKELSIGTTIIVKPTLEADGEKILLELEFKHTNLLGFIEGLPQTEIVQIKTRVLVPNGSTLLLGGQKLTNEQDGQEVLKTLFCLVKAEKL